MLANLTEAMSKIAPIIGVSIGRLDDRSTWRIDYHDEATPEQRAAAEAAMASWSELASRMEEYAGKVDSDAESARLRFITGGAGMGMTYQEKFAQAQGVSAMGEQAANAMSQEDREAQFPTLSASVGIEAPTLWDAAQLVLQKYTEFVQLSLVIERTRLAGKAAIKAASDVQGVRAAYEAIAWPTP
jgi:hypothetical protein